MRQIFKNKITWIDIASPTEDDIEYLRKHYKLHPLICEELTGPSQRSKTERYNDYLFLVIHFPSWDPQKKISSPWELDVILGKDVLVTVYYHQKSEMHQELLEKIYNTNFEKTYLTNTVKLLHFIIEDFINFTLREIVHIQTKIDTVEEQIFQGKHEQAIPNLSFIKRDILNFKRISSYLRANLESLSRRGPILFGKESQIYFDDLADDSLKVNNLITNFKDIIESLENTNDSLMNHKTNALTKVYTIISFITWPSLLIISLYQMNVNNMPLANNANGFWEILIVSFVPSVFIYFYVKRRKFL